MKKFILNIFVSLCLLCTLSFLPSFVLAASGQTTILNGKVVSPVIRYQTVPFHGIVKEVLVSPGQSVMKDQVMMRYSLLEEGERALQKEVDAGANTESTVANMLSLERNLATAIAQRNKAKKLASAGLGSDQALSTIEGDVTSLRKRITLLKKTISKQEENFAKRLEELSDYFGTTIKEGMTLPKELVLLAPIDGYVLSVALDLYPESQVYAGAAPIVVGKMDPMLIQVQVFEGDMDNLKVGDIANVTIPSLDDKVFKATVAKIAWTSHNVNVEQPSYFTVELTIPNSKLELKVGFKAIVELGGNTVAAPPATQEAPKQDAAPQDKS